jgi:hypothetical protein
MTPEEAVNLTRYVRALCPQQKFDEYTADAWYDILSPHDLQDCRAAAANLAARQPFVAPAEIVAEVKRIRAQRLENFQYEPVAGETTAEYLARLRGQQAAIASGRVTPPASRPALEGGPHKDVAKVLEGFGRAVPESDEEAARDAARAAGPLGVVCPVDTCQAAIGRPCKTPGATDARPLGTPRRPHGARRRAAVGIPERTAAERAAEEERIRAASARSLQRLEADEDIPDAVIVEDGEGAAS